MLLRKNFIVSFILNEENIESILLKIMNKTGVTAIVLGALANILGQEKRKVIRITRKTSHLQ